MKLLCHRILKFDHKFYNILVFLYSMDPLSKNWASAGFLQIKNAPDAYMSKKPPHSGLESHAAFASSKFSCRSAV